MPVVHNLAVPFGVQPPPEPVDLSHVEYQYFSTDWATGSIREELSLTRVSFNTPINDHGQFTGTLLLPRSGSANIYLSCSPEVSGLLVTRRGIPVWDGWVLGRRTTTDQDGMAVYGAFELTAYEWGSWFDRQLLRTLRTFSQVDDHDIFRALVQFAAQEAAPARSPGILLGSTKSGVLRDRTYYPYESAMYGERMIELSQVIDGPDWAFVSALESGKPVRRLQLGSPLGRQTMEKSGLVLEYVAAGMDEPYDEPPVPIPFQELALAASSRGAQVSYLHGSGGNVISVPDIQEDGTSSATRWVATGAGEDASKLIAYSDNDDLLAIGWPSVWGESQYEDVTVKKTLQSHADADLQAGSGLATLVKLDTYGVEPDWTQVQRGDLATVYLDAPWYAPRPKTYQARVLDIAVNPPDAEANGGVGPDVVTYTLAQTVEVPR